MSLVQSLMAPHRPPATSAATHHTAQVLRPPRQTPSPLPPGSLHSLWRGGTAGGLGAAGRAQREGFGILASSPPTPGTPKHPVGRWWDPVSARPVKLNEGKLELLYPGY